VEKSRLHIPLLFGYDVIHGFQTVFPVPIAMAASWDPEVPEKAQAFAAREARASGINWTFGGGHCARRALGTHRRGRGGRSASGSGTRASGELTYWSESRKAWVEEPEQFDVWVGGDSNAQLHARFRVVE